MRRLKRAAVYLSLLVLGQSGHAALIFSNLSDPQNAATFFNSTQWLAHKVNVGASALTFDNFVVSITSHNPTNPVVASICADNAGVPNLNPTSCSIFTTTDSIQAAPAFSNVSYTGSYAAAANATVWIVLKTSGVGNYQWGGSSSTALPWSYTLNSGISWTPAVGTELLHSISGTATLAPASVPTLSEWAMIALALLIVGFSVYQRRRRHS